MISIRKATTEDEDEVFELLHQLMSGSYPAEKSVKSQKGIDTYLHLLNNEDTGTIIVAEEDGKLVGIITLSYPLAIRCGGIYTCIEEFIVHESMRGKGVGGRLLLQATIDEARLRGCDELQVNNPSEMGYPLYLRYNVEDTGKHMKIKLATG